MVVLTETVKNMSMGGDGGCGSVSGGFVFKRIKGKSVIFGNS